MYEVKPVDQHYYIELTIIPDPAMPPEYEVESQGRIQTFKKGGSTLELQLQSVS